MKTIRRGLAIILSGTVLSLFVSPAFAEAADHSRSIDTTVHVASCTDMVNCDEWVETVLECVGCLAAIAGVIAGAKIAAAAAGAAGVLSGLGIIAGGTAGGWSIAAILGAILTPCGLCATDDCIHYMADQLWDVIVDIFNAFEQYGGCASLDIREEFNCLFGPI